MRTYTASQTSAQHPLEDGVMASYFAHLAGQSKANNTPMKVS